MSGFRIAGFLLLTLALIFLLLLSTTLLTGKGENSTLLHKLLGGLGLLAIATVMFLSVRYWAKWFIGFLGYAILKLAVSALLGWTPSVPSIARPHFLFLEYLVISVLAVVICFKYVSHAPREIETFGLIGLVISFSFATVYDSAAPLLIGVLLLASIQVGEHWRRRSWAKAHRRAATSWIEHG